MSSPHSHRSSKEYHTPDIYSDAQNLTARKDDYEHAQEAASPETYRDKYRTVYRLVKFYRVAFPYLSAITLGALAFFLTLGFDVFTDPPEESSALAIGIIGFAGFVLLIAINEAVKSRSLKAWFKALALKRKPEPGTPTLASITTVISIVGSAVGVFLITWQIANNAPEIEAQADQGKRSARLAFSADSARIMDSYQPLIQSKRDAIERYDPNRYRTLRDRLNNEAIELTEKMNGELAAARERADGKETEISSSMASDLAANDQQGTERSWFAFAVLVALELMNLFCNRFEWVYLANVEKEGIEFGAIQSSQERTMYEIQVARFSQWANQVAQQYGLPGQAAPVAQGQTKPPIGFQTGPKPPINPGQPQALEDIMRQFWEGVNPQVNPQVNPPSSSEVERALFDDSSQAPAGLSESDFAYLRKYREAVRDFQKGASFSQVSQAHSISRSTAQNIKRTAKAANLLT